MIGKIFPGESPPRVDRRRGAKKSENGGGMNIKNFFFHAVSKFHGTIG